MKKNFFIFLVLIIFCSCVGSPAWYSMKMGDTKDEADENNKKMLSLEIGQTKPELLNIMGSPAKIEAYQLPNNKIIEFMFYRTSGWGNDYSDQDYQFTPIALENKKLVGWGRNFYDNVIRQAVDINVK